MYVVHTITTGVVDRQHDNDNIPTKSICRLFFRTTHVKGRRSYYGLGNIVRLDRLDRLDRLAKSPDCKYARYSAQSCV
jgi:hypothetical protein